MKVASIIGARPQFIKAATVSRVFREYHSGVNEVLIHTGQHYDSNMSDVFFDELDIPKPGYNLGIGGGTHGRDTGRMIESIEAVLLTERPNCVLVYGDTNSTLAGALAAAKLYIPVVHVEAGLRSFNRLMPEEINRVLTDHIADLLFAPTETAVANLRAEGIPAERIQLLGDVMYDAALFYRGLARRPDWFREGGLTQGEFVLATVHRAENTDDPKRLARIFSGLSRSGCQVVIPLHPRTREKLTVAQISLAQNIHVAPPVGYLEMVWLEMNARLIATDSGGVQKEAFFHGKPCITLRDETEWVELVETGWNTIVGTDEDRIARALLCTLPPLTKPLLYGEGDTAEKIVNIIKNKIPTCSYSL